MVSRRMSVLPWVRPETSPGASLPKGSSIESHAPRQLPPEGSTSPKAFHQLTHDLMKAPRSPRRLRRTLQGREHHLSFDVKTPPQHRSRNGTIVIPATERGTLEFLGSE